MAAGTNISKVSRERHSCTGRRNSSTRVDLENLISLVHQCPSSLLFHILSIGGRVSPPSHNDRDHHHHNKNVRPVRKQKRSPKLNLVSPICCIQIPRKLSPPLPFPKTGRGRKKESDAYKEADRNNNETFTKKKKAVGKEKGTKEGGPFLLNPHRCAFPFHLAGRTTVLYAKQGVGGGE